MMLTNTKVGDVLCVGQQSDAVLVTVIATTATRVRCGTWTFNRRGNRIPRQKWVFVHARPATDKDIAEIEEETRRQHCIHIILAKCDNINRLREMNTEKLSRLAAIVEEEE